MNKILEYLKKEKVLCVALILAAVSAFFVHPDVGYLEYVDVRVLALLFCLMLIVKGFQDIGLFDLLIGDVGTVEDDGKHHRDIILRSYQKPVGFKQSTGRLVGRCRRRCCR